MYEYGIVQNLLSLADQNVRDHDDRWAVRVVVVVEGTAGWKSATCAMAPTPSSRKPQPR